MDFCSHRKYSVLTPLSAMILLSAFAVSLARGQSPEVEGRNGLGVQTRISEQRVQRQTEVMRLESMIERLGGRVTRMERQLLTNTRFPALTVSEANAALELAKMRQTETQNQGTPVSKVQFASDRLAMIQAETQLRIAQASEEERRIMLDLDRIYAEREYLDQSRRLEQLERLVAKGYSTSDGLALRRLDVELARKQFELAKLRQETQQQLSQAKPETLNDTNSSSPPTMNEQP